MVSFTPPPPESAALQARGKIYPNQLLLLLLLLRILFPSAYIVIFNVMLQRLLIPDVFVGCHLVASCSPVYVGWLGGTTTETIIQKYIKLQLLLPYLVRPCSHPQLPSGHAVFCELTTWQLQSTTPSLFGTGAALGQWKKQVCIKYKINEFRIP